MTHTLMIVEDEPAQSIQLRDLIKDQTGCRCIAASSGREAVEYFLLRMQPRPDLVLVDLSLSGMSGLEVIRAIRRSDPFISIVALCNRADSSETVTSISLGVDDVLYKPLNRELLTVSIRNLLQRNVLRQEVRRLHRLEDGRVLFSDLLGKSEAMQQMMAVAKGASESTNPICIEGASGTGKEMFARAIHGSSARVGQPFVTINCQMLVDSLKDHLAQKQSVRDCLARRLYAAHGGSVLIKAPHALSEQNQQFLLSVLKEKRIYLYAHDKEPRDINIRMMFGVEGSLAEIYRNGEMIDDLYYRFSSLLLKMVPLNQRKQDIIPLAEYFLRHNAAMIGKLVSDIEPEAVRLLMACQWPGNITQLSHVMHHAVMDCKHRKLGAEEVLTYIKSDCDVDQMQRYGDYMMKSQTQQGVASMLRQDGNVRPLDELEAEMIRYAIEHYKGKMTEVARRLGIGRSTLYRKIQDYSIQEAC